VSRTSDFFDHFRVEGGGWLIEQHNARFHAEATRDGHALLLTAGELAWIFFRLLWDLDLGEEVHRRFLGFLLRRFPNPDRGERAVFEDGQMREQIEVLEHHADLGADGIDVLQIRGQKRAVDLNAALLVLLQRVDAADQRRFAGARRPADHDALAPEDM